MTTRRHARSGERGSTLLEAMVALSILLVGLLGMARLQIYGLAATQGARAHTIAMQLASELGAALERLPSDDGRISGSHGTTVNDPPANFGRILKSNGTVPTTGVHEWSDDADKVIPGARLESTLERDPANPSQPAFRRRWTVWDTGVTGSGAAAKLIAVSVVYRERGVPNPREVVIYVHSELRGSFMANIAAFN